MDSLSNAVNRHDIVSAFGRAHDDAHDLRKFTATSPTSCTSSNRMTSLWWIRVTFATYRSDTAWRRNGAVSANARICANATHTGP